MQAHALRTVAEVRVALLEPRRARRRVARRGPRQAAPPRPTCKLALLAASIALAPPSGHGTSPAQALRTCVDRWNQGKRANVAFRLPVAKERASIALSSRRRCIVAIEAGDGTWTCVLVDSGAYWCPPLHEPTGPPLKALQGKNAIVDRRGLLRLHSPLKGTHPTPPLVWQRYPHLDAFVLPWTAGGKLRPGLRFEGAGRGRCFRIDETARFAISCLAADGSRFDACFPQRRTSRAGDVAACGALGDTRFVRWTITGRS